MKYRLIKGDVLAFCRHYHGEPFHAMLCDPPYHLTSITKRFGKNGSKPPKGDVYARSSRGFMNSTWDGGDVAFRPETWAALSKLLYPGAFIAAFSGSRGWHRQAVAMENAGLIMHPTIFLWAQAQGFPKATRIKGNKDFEGYRYGLQAIKPAVEPILVFQRPYAGKPVDSIVATGAGALNIEGGRIPGNVPSVPQPVFDSPTGAIYGFKTGKGRNGEMSRAEGRWPANFALTHHPDCAQIGTRKMRHNGGTGEASEHGNAIFGNQTHERFWYVDPDGLETIDDWQCVPGCPVRVLDEQSGVSSASGKPTPANTEPTEADSRIYGFAKYPAMHKSGAHFGDSGTASRFFHNSDWAAEIAEQIALADPVMYQAKANRRERDSGLSERSSHPTVKPLALCRWLATLLLPPTAYAPRRILVPFAGSGSEMIGALQAGWDETIGIEMENEYVDIGKVRLAYWANKITEEMKKESLPLFPDMV